MFWTWLTSNSFSRWEVLPSAKITSVPNPTLVSAQSQSQSTTATTNQKAAPAQPLVQYKSTLKRKLLIIIPWYPGQKYRGPVQKAALVKEALAHLTHITVMEVSPYLRGIPNLGRGWPLRTSIILARTRRVPTVNILTVPLMGFLIRIYTFLLLVFPP